jgi:L-arabinose isomerase
MDVLADFAEIAGLELLPIDAATTTRGFHDALRWNQAYWFLNRGT